MPPLLVAAARLRLKKKSKANPNPSTGKKTACLARARGVKSASRKKIPKLWGCVFFDSAQSRVLSGENASHYDGSASGELYLDTPRVITDTAGNTVWQWDNLDPFGANMANENPSGAGTFAFNLRFSGQYFDKETGLHQNYFRDYDPGSGRYTEFDPIGLAAGINGFIYVENNPLSYIDPLGLDKTIWWPPGSGRGITDGPRNGNWGGGKWSGGVSGGGTGNASALDSGDECYQRHDQCFDSGTSKASCNRKLVDELKALPDDSKKWPRPPASGTEKDSERYRQGAITIFGR